MIRAAGVAWLVAVIAARGAGAAMPGPVDPDWPCQQIKVPEMSLASIWQGPPIEQALATWSQDPALDDMVRRLTPRRVPIDTALGTIEHFAKARGAEDGRTVAPLLGLFAGLYDTLNRERASVVGGLDRFGRRQRELAAGIRADAESLRAAQAKAAQDKAGQEAAAKEAQVATLTERLTWETRLFEQRRQSISFACAVPDVIEQRVFAFARAIQKLLPP